VTEHTDRSVLLVASGGVGCVWWRLVRDKDGRTEASRFASADEARQWAEEHGWQVRGD